MALEILPGQWFQSATAFDCFSGQADCSFQAWFEVTAPPSGISGNSYFLIVNDNQYAFDHQMFADGYAHDHIKNQIGGFTYPFSQGVIGHVIWTYQSGQQYLYVNGGQFSMGTATGPIASTNGVLFIGDWEGHLGTCKFVLDGVAGWYGHALSPAEVSALYSGTSTPDALGATFYHKLNGTIGANMTNGDAALADFMGNKPALVLGAGVPKYVAGIAPSGGPPPPTYTQLSQAYISQLADMI